MQELILIWNTVFFHALFAVLKVPKGQKQSTTQDAEPLYGKLSQADLLLQN